LNRPDPASPSLWDRLSGTGKSDKKYPQLLDGKTLIKGSSENELLAENGGPVNRLGKFDSLNRRNFTKVALWMSNEKAVNESLLK
jgi:hypothetical protein